MLYNTYHISTPLKNFCLSLGILMILFAIEGCTSNSEKPNKQSKVPTSTNKDHSLKLSTLSSIPYPLRDSLSILEQVFEQKTLGLSLTLTIPISDSLIKVIKTKGFDGLYVNFFCKLPNKGTYNSLSDLNLKKRIALNKENFISKPLQHSFTTHLPYRVIPLGSGLQNLTIGYSLLGMKLDKENEQNLNTYFIKKIDTNCIFKKTFQTTANFPKLTRVAIQVNKFELETTQNQENNYDFSLGGTGLPDLYWSVWCGNALIYASPQIKNSTIYTQTYHSDSFVCTDKDIITIQLADYDNGPFNTQDDIIAEWQGKAEDIPQKIDTLHFNKLKYLILKGNVKP